MRLFHVSEEANIREFIPRIPARSDMSKEFGVVWAVDENRLPNFLTPRDCPRVCFHIGPNTDKADAEKFFTSPTITHAIVIEHKWYEVMKSTTVSLHENTLSDRCVELEWAVCTSYVQGSVYFERHN